MDGHIDIERHRVEGNSRKHVHVADTPSAGGIAHLIELVILRLPTQVAPMLVAGVAVSMQVQGIIETVVDG